MTKKQKQELLWIIEEAQAVAEDMGEKKKCKLCHDLFFEVLKLKTKK